MKHNLKSDMEVGVWKQRMNTQKEVIQTYPLAICFKVRASFNTNYILFVAFYIFHTPLSLIF
jgi:hypothetical protein